MGTEALRPHGRSPDPQREMEPAVLRPRACDCSCETSGIPLLISGMIIGGNAFPLGRASRRRGGRSRPHPLPAGAPPPQRPRGRRRPSCSPRGRTAKRAAGRGRPSTPPRGSENRAGRAVTVPARRVIHERRSARSSLTRQGATGPLTHRLPLTSAIGRALSPAVDMSRFRLVFRF